MFDVRNTLDDRTHLGNRQNPFKLNIIVLWDEQAQTLAVYGGDTRRHWMTQTTDDCTAGYSTLNHYI